MRHSQDTPSRFPRGWAPVHRLRADGENIGTPVGRPAPLPLSAAISVSKKPRTGVLCRLRALLAPRIGQGSDRPWAPQPSREARLQSVAFKLECILDELDEIDAQRIAIDVCMALERVRAQLATTDATATPALVADH